MPPHSNTGEEPSKQHGMQPSDSSIMPTTNKMFMLCCSALQCTCTWKTWGLNSRYRKKENRRREQKEKSKKSTPLPQRHQHQSRIYTLCRSPETNRRHRHVSGSSYNVCKDQRRNSEFEPPQDEEVSKQLQLLLGFYSLACRVSEEFRRQWRRTLLLRDKLVLRKVW
jgi:hypothetical protein